jgi:hypothetical protein
MIAIFASIFLWMVTKTTFGFTSFVLPHELELEKVKHKLTSKLGAMPNRVYFTNKPYE